MAEYTYDGSFDCIRADALFLRGQHKEAFGEYFRGATVLRSGRAAHNTAFMYYMGYYVPRNYYMARKFYTAASYMDGGEAGFNLALMHMRGQGTPPDFSAAVECMRRSAALDCIEAQMYLGNAYTVGFVFDPVDIECLSLIPFHRLIKRSERYIAGGIQTDNNLEDKRWEVIEADEYEALSMFRAAAGHSDTTYTGEMSGLAEFMVGRSLIEGFGEEYDPAKGYRMILGAAKKHGSREAIIYLSENKEAARAYGVNPDGIIRILEQNPPK